MIQILSRVDADGCIEEDGGKVDLVYCMLDDLVQNNGRGKIMEAVEEEGDKEGGGGSIGEYSGRTINAARVPAGESCHSVR